MPGKPLHTLAAIAGLALAACAHSSQPTKDDRMSPSAKPASQRLQPVKEWPLRFKQHSFGVYTYDTYGVKVYYAGRLQADEDDSKLQPSAASYGDDYQSNWHGGHIDIRNFPAPAEVTWRSKDGASHEARIDIGEIFRDEVIRHRVSRGEISDQPDGEYPSMPHIALEINDRTIRVYMAAMIYTKELQKPGNAYSGFRYDLILAKTYTY